MPLTPSEDKMLALLKSMAEPNAEQRAMIDVLEEKSREAGIVITQPQDNRLANAKVFLDKVASGAVQEYVLVGVGPNIRPEIVLSYSIPPTPSDAMSSVVRQLSILFENRLQELLRAKAM